MKLEAAVLWLEVSSSHRRLAAPWASSCIGVFAGSSRRHFVPQLRSPDAAFKSECANEHVSELEKGFSRSCAAAPLF